MMTRTPCDATQKSRQLVRKPPSRSICVMLQLRVVTQKVFPRTWRIVFFLHASDALHARECLTWDLKMFALRRNGQGTANILKVVPMRKPLCLFRVRRAA